MIDPSGSKVLLDVDNDDASPDSITSNSLDSPPLVKNSESISACDWENSIGFYLLFDFCKESCNPEILNTPIQCSSQFAFVVPQTTSTVVLIIVQSANMHQILLVFIVNLQHLFVYKILSTF